MCTPIDTTANNKMADSEAVAMIGKGPDQPATNGSDPMADSEAVAMIGKGPDQPAATGSDPMADSENVIVTLKGPDQPAATGSDPGSDQPAATGSDPLKKISDDLQEDHRNNLYCEMIFQLVGATGNVLVVVAFGFMFNPNLFHYSDYIAASGSAVSLLSNIGILLADRKLRYDNRKLVKEDLFKLITDGTENSQIVLNSQSLKTLIDISVRPEESLIIKVMKLMKQPVSSCGRCQDTCPSEDPDVPLCTCSCGPCSDSYACSFLSFMLTPGFFEDTFQVVSSGWLLSSNIKAIADRVQNSDPPDNLISMGSLGMICEFVELTLAVLSVFIFIAFSFYQCRSRQNDEKPNIINKVNELGLEQASSA